MTRVLQRKKSPHKVRKVVKRQILSREGKTYRKPVNPPAPISDNPTKKVLSVSQAPKDIILPFKKQRRFIRQVRTLNKTINIAEGSVRSGKTIGTILAWLEILARLKPSKSQHLIMVGKTDGSLYRNVIRPMTELVGSDLKYYPGKVYISLWGHNVFVFGANDERSENKIRGMTVRKAYCDEITLFPYSFWVQLRNRMSCDDSQVIATTNPDSPAHWLKKEVLDRWETTSLYWMKFLIEDNIHLPRKYIAELRSELTGLWYDRFFLGKWVLAEGSIYDFFEENNKYLLTEDEAAELRADYYVVSIDYGTTNPTSIGYYGVNHNYNGTTKPKAWKIDECYYDSKVTGVQKTDLEQVEMLKKFLKDKIPPDKIIVDPSAASFIAQLERSGFWNVIPAENAVLDGIRLQAQMLRSGAYKIVDVCHQTIRDYGSYVWDENAQKKGEDKPKKENDHTKDEERYFIETEFGEIGLTYVGLAA